MSYSLPAFAIFPGVMANQLIQSPVQVKAIKLSNGSPFDVQISGFGTPGTHWIPAGTEYLIPVQNQSSGNISILPFNNNNIPGFGICLITLYYADEDLPVGNWPVSIPTQTVQAKVSTVTSLVNDGNAAGTQIFESIATGAPGSSNSITNDGLWLIKVLAAGVLHQVLQTSSTGNPLKLGQLGDTVEVLGGLLVDQFFECDNQKIGSDGNGNWTTIGTTSLHDTLQMLKTPKSLNGSTSGTLSIYHLFGGTFKVDLVVEAGYKNGSAPAQTLVFDEAYTTVGGILVFGDIAGFSLLNGGLAQSGDVVTALATAGGTTSSQTVFNGSSLIGMKHPFDTFSASGGNGSVHTGVALILGV